MKLFVYDHCPYCVKARMIFPLKHIPFEKIILLNNDEQTPKNMIGRKVVPILQKTDGSYLSESMDIVHYIDSLSGPSVLTGKTNPAINTWLLGIAEYANYLLLPRYAESELAEFATPAARDYFIHKKEDALGYPLSQLYEKTPLLLERITTDLAVLEPLIVSPKGCNGTLSEDDIHLFAMLRSLTIIKKLTLPEKIKNYLINMSKITNINLFDPIAV